MNAPPIATSDDERGVPVSYEEHTAMVCSPRCYLASRAAIAEHLTAWNVAPPIVAKLPSSLLP